jgi:predicted permease
MFLIMAVGYFCKRVGLLREGQVSSFNTIAFRVFMPCLVFYNLYSSDLSSAVRPRLVVFTVCAIFAVYAAATAAVLIFEKRPERRGVLIQGIYRSNYVVIGLPIATALLPAEQLGVVSLLIAVVIPIYNVLAVVTLAVYQGKRVPVKKTVVNILTNPLILGAAAGLLFLALGLRLPTALDTAVKDMAAVATPLQLFLLGGFFRFDGLRRYARPLTWAVLGRLVLAPAAALSAAALLGFRGAEFVALIGCFTSSNAISSFVMTQQMGGDEVLAGDIVVLTSALCSFTAFGWTFLFKTLGMF